jgi:hypothetical protein
MDMRPTLGTSGAGVATDPTTAVVAERIVHAIDRLDLLDLQGSDLSDWTLTEGEWIADHLPASGLGAPAVRAYADAVVLLLSVLKRDADTGSAVAAVIATRSAMVALAGRHAGQGRATIESMTVTHQVGQAIPFSIADATIDVTVGSIERWSGSSYDAPRDGHRWVTVEVLVTGVAGTLDGPPSYTDFTVADASGRVFEPEPAWREPQLPFGSDFESIGEGQTVRGWITFELPSTLDAGTIRLTEVDGGAWAFAGIGG